MPSAFRFSKGQRKFIDFKSTYSGNAVTEDEYWSDETKRGDVVDESEVVKGYFTLKRNPDDVTPILEFTTDEVTEMDWVVEDGVSILRVKFGEAQDDLDGIYFFECRVKMADSTGGFVEVDSGTIEFLNSIVGTP